MNRWITRKTLILLTITFLPLNAHAASKKVVCIAWGSAAVTVHSPIIYSVYLFNPISGGLYTGAAFTVGCLNGILLKKAFTRDGKPLPSEQLRALQEMEKNKTLSLRTEGEQSDPPGNENKANDEEK